MNIKRYSRSDLLLHIFAKERSRDNACKAFVFKQWHDEVGQHQYVMNLIRLAVRLLVQISSVV